MKGTFFAGHVVSRVSALLLVVAMLSGCGKYARSLDSYLGEKAPSDKELVISENETLLTNKSYKNFILKGQARTEEGSEAALYFHLESEVGLRDCSAQWTHRRYYQDG